MFVHLSIGELAEPGFSQGFFSISVTLWSLGVLPLSPMVLIHTACFFWHIGYPFLVKTDQVLFTV